MDILEFTDNAAVVFDGHDAWNYSLMRTTECYCCRNGRITLLIVLRR